MRLPGATYVALGRILDPHWEESKMSQIIYDSQIEWDQAKSRKVRFQIVLFLHLNVWRLFSGIAFVEVIKHTLISSLIHWWRG